MKKDRIQIYEDQNGIVTTTKPGFLGRLLGSGSEKLSENNQERIMGISGVLNALDERSFLETASRSQQAKLREAGRQTNEMLREMPKERPSELPGILNNIEKGGMRSRTEMTVTSNRRGLFGKRESNTQRSVVEDQIPPGIDLFLHQDPAIKRVGLKIDPERASFSAGVAFSGNRSGMDDPNGVLSSVDSRTMSTQYGTMSETSAKGPNGAFAGSKSIVLGGTVIDIQSGNGTTFRLSRK